jgi:hypothetical protein
MRTRTRESIISYITERGQARVQELHEVMRLSRVAIHKQLNRLIADGAIVRAGRPPLVFYTLSSPKTVISVPHNIPIHSQSEIEKNFLFITPDGKLLFGIAGFTYWAHTYQTNKPLEDLIRLYNQTSHTHEEMRRTRFGLIEATEKLDETFTAHAITNLFFQDVYSYPMFGRTKLAKLVMHAKQTGERQLIDTITDLARPGVHKLIEKYHIDAIGYIPPTVPRPLQFMDELQTHLNIQLPVIELVKVTPGDIPIPQKTLATREERMLNARNSIFVKQSTIPYKHILLIDDVVGSGASFYETAQKLKQISTNVSTIIALGLVGNRKGYEVIRDI